MEWSDYIIMAAQHSKGSARHWFRYLRKDIDKCGMLFTIEDVEKLSRNVKLSPFQRVSLKAAFSEGSPTRQHIRALNNKASQEKINIVKAKYANSNN